MNRLTVNDTFTLQIPDHYEVLTEADLRGMYRNAGDPFMWGVRDTENHRIIVAIWKQYPALLSWTLEIGKDRALSGAARSLLGANGFVCTYTVEYAETLGGTWKPLASGTVALDHVQQMTDSIQAAIDANPKSCFFRVVLGK